MILEVCWDGLWTLSFGLSQFHGHGSWLVCEVALRVGLDYGSVPGRIEHGQDPSVSKSNRLHVDIFRFFFINLRYILINSSKMIGKFPEVLNFNRLFLKLNRFICN